MLKSMTGYGRSQQTIDGRDILVEIKAVNHRYFEFNTRIPRAYAYLEDKMKTLVSSSASRGKIDVSISIFTVEGKDAEVQINLELARGYVNALRSTKDELNLVDNLSLSSISRFSDIFLVSKTVEDEEVIWNEVKQVAQEALEKFIDMRVIEGERMHADIQSRLHIIEDYVTQIEELAPKTVSDYKDRLYAKLKEVLENKNIDEQRVLTEVALFAEKIAVDEETVRLRSHLKQFHNLIESKDSVGRKLDFLVQEVNREVNTIGSKCQDLAVTSIVVEMKSEIEKIREQIQNIE
ncbi:YicC/YloC family endoribonuclease [Paludicola sp. MB14-C6]|uniref:YicC/YloC family endoribonuclease n=1 Tax=Paludihabitans sp. MB14-C6 TaxID=3070656 RepID=UPI0027DC2423|nr:YicC/YloC family endoribonuclease [Paludicola sp. MB14-C6]WMJ22372.1 YicC/YloC family endoribonuclease [Paludicola sp. MB14-C6]